MDDVDVIALGVSPDPYVARQVWAGDALAALGAALDARAAQWRADAIAAVLAETRRTRAEPWMDAMIAARVTADRRIAHAEAVRSLVTRAFTDGGTLAFFGD
jgi:hypothetical protein